MMTDRPPPWLQKKKDDAGQGVSKRVSDNAFWLEPDPELDAWVDALEAIDRRADPAQLLKLLAPGVPPSVLPHLEDLFKRMRWAPKDKRTTPTYDRTAREAQLALAKRRVADLVEVGLLVKDALEQVAVETGIPLTVLGNSYEGRRGSTRRMRRRP